MVRPQIPAGELGTIIVGRDVQRLPTTRKKESTLTTEQINNIRELMQR